MSTTILFDELYYTQINEARWAAAVKVLHEIPSRAGLALSTCLDVGCGPGWFSQRLAALGLRVEGLDGRIENVEEARRRVPGVRFHHADIESEAQIAGFPGYDLVFCFGLLYHTENPFRVVRNLRGLTKGVLLLESVVVPDASPCAWLVAENDNATQGLTTYAMIPSRSAVAKMLQASGLEHVYEHTGPVDHQDFEESAARHRKRRIFIACHRGLSIEQAAPIPPVATPKYDFAKR